MAGGQGPVAAGLASPRTARERGGQREVRNRSGIPIEPLYTPAHWSQTRHEEDLGAPGAYPFTRGIYPGMHRERPWSQRQLIGLGLPEDYNARTRALIAGGATALSIIPCNSFMRGYDIDAVEPELVGTCGTTLNTVEDLAICLEGIPIESVSIGLNDPLPFTMQAMLLALARRRGVPWPALRGTANQSDYLSHYVANHMFYRLSLPGSRRVLLDQIAWMNAHAPRFNPLSVVGQHMQQAGATPAQAMAFTLCSAIQYGEDCLARGMDPDVFLPRFSFFFDISLSFFEEVAKFRAGRRIWARIARERLGARDPRSWRFKFHGQTSGADLTWQQPRNNTVRVAVQAMAGILGGLQSLHTDSYDEALSTPTEEAARIAIATQNILREEAGLADVIDPLGGSYYVESLTNAMEAEIDALIARIDEAGGMYAAVEQGLVQALIGESALAFQRQMDGGERIVVGVNAYRGEEQEEARRPLERPTPEAVRAQIARLRAYRAARSQAAFRRAMDDLAEAARDAERNVYEALVEAVLAGATHGEVVGCLREELGFGQPQVAV
jgi:methylmalonyl-CoA mutase N-terminal domain/subunit